ncbi:hypothetical protein [Derxia gummosa]|uniref:Cytochrome C n=1 Tax=Derxia gummosa DSM 723 TaxID=1121388 RepID=A0A8B6X3P9_9BURK|nr:hypothetical protein [Derxia gummosa]
MRKAIAAAVALLVLASAGIGSALSAEDELDNDLMQAIEDSNKSLASYIATKDQKGATTDANDLAKMFETVETFYVKKGDAADAVELAKKSRELTAQILKQVSTKNFDAATDTATTLSRTCKTCHNFYKKS